jgi:hypothetical protein
MAVLVALPLSGALVVKVVRSERRRRKPWDRASETLSRSFLPRGTTIFVLPKMWQFWHRLVAESAL